MSKLFLGIGSNLGDRESILKDAVAGIIKSIGPVVAASSVYETEPWGFRSENKFLNMVVEVDTSLTPVRVMGRILLIESLLGRIRSEKKYSSRLIDIDILLYDDLIIDTKNLIIPHPRIPERKFVLVPLCEIAPDLIHPVMNKSFASLLISSNDRSEVRKYIL